jgi:hypothetical protein
MRWAGHVALMVKKRNEYKLLVGKRPLRRSRHRWVNNIMIDLLGIDWGAVDRIGLAQDTEKWGALVNAVMNLRVP